MQHTQVIQHSKPSISNLAINITSLVLRQDGGEDCAAKGDWFSTMLKGKVLRKVVEQTVMMAVYRASCSPACATRLKQARISLKVCGVISGKAGPCTHHKLSIYSCCCRCCRQLAIYSRERRRFLGVFYLYNTTLYLTPAFPSSNVLVHTSLPRKPMSPCMGTAICTSPMTSLNCSSRTTTTTVSD
ncbi:hypothetical protein K438DRAFT_240756 [Mycena galopus ATCC 62051]|nr:hypothetical protein K438DRAFT_240756 [Mycena galopus ATCC 62051]